jgi:hypothetical protein
LRGLSRGPDPGCAAALRAVWLAGGVADRKVCRVPWQAACLLLGPRGCHLRRCRASPRLGLEGAWAASARACRGGDRGGCARSAGRGGARVRARRSRPFARARTPPGRVAGTRARPCVEPPSRLPSAPISLSRAPARARPEGATKQRCRCVRSGSGLAGLRLPRRRHLHEWSHRRRRGFGAPEGRCAQSRGRDLRSCDPLTVRYPGVSRHDLG